MMKTVIHIIILILICSSCQLLEDQETFDYDLYNSSFGIFDFGFYEVPQSLEVSQNCDIYVSGTTSKMHDPTDYLLLKFNFDGKLDTKFSDNGHMMFDIDAGIDEGNQILLNDDNKIIDSDISFDIDNYTFNKNDRTKTVNILNQTTDIRIKCFISVDENQYNNYIHFQ